MNTHLWSIPVWMPVSEGFCKWTGYNPLTRGARVWRCWSAYYVTCIRVRIAECGDCASQVAFFRTALSIWAGWSSHVFTRLSFGLLEAVGPGRGQMAFLHCRIYSLLRAVCCHSMWYEYKIHLGHVDLFLLYFRIYSSNNNNNNNNLSSAQLGGIRRSSLNSLAS